MQILSFTAVGARIAAAHGTTRAMANGRVGYYRREGLVIGRYSIQHATGAPVTAYGPVDLAVAAVLSRVQDTKLCNLAALRAVSSICYDWRNVPEGEEPPFDHPIEQLLADIAKGRKRNLKLRFYQHPQDADFTFSVQATLNGKFNDRPSSWSGFTEITLDLTGALRGLI